MDDTPFYDERPSAEPALSLRSFGPDGHAAVIGATGGIGGALVAELAATTDLSTVCALSRSPRPTSLDSVSASPVDLEDEESIADAARRIGESVGVLHLVIVATGILHDADRLQPEKTWRSLNAGAMERAFRINTIGPALVAKHFLPLLARERKSAFAAISARVGSIGDNQLGGWHAYRASKAALNMVIRTTAIELARRNPAALCVGLHPGTVDTALSKPFQAGVAEGRLFSPRRSARHLLTVLDTLTPEASGHLYAWDGQKIPF